MNADQRQRISAELDAQHPYPEGDSEGGHAFALDADAPQYEAVAIVSAPASLDARLAAVEAGMRDLAAALDRLGTLVTEGRV